MARAIAMFSTPTAVVSVCAYVWPLAVARLSTTRCSSGALLPASPPP
jgi:hypothetical protein